MAETPQCEHKANNPEGTEWSDADSLDHFLHCISPAEQAYRWRSMRGQLGVARACFEHDHPGQIEMQRVYTVRLLTGIRELLDEKSRDGAHIRERLARLIS